MMNKSLILFIISLFFLGCTNHPPLATVEKVDINRYLGTWYEIARFDHSFERGCSHVTATYALKENGDIKVLNRCIDETGQEDIAKGSAFSTTPENNKLKVTFFWPFYGNYWILMLDKKYSYAVVGDPSRNYLWILSRSKSLNKKSLDTIIKKLPSLGFDTSKLIWTKQ